MTNDEMAEMIAERNGSQRFCKNCDDCCHQYNSTDDCFKSAMEMAKWKDEQMKQYLQHGKEFAQEKGNHDLAELFEIIIEDLKL